LTVVLVAETPGRTNLQFLIGGTPLGETVSINAEGSTVGKGVGAVFTRTLPADLPSGSYVVEVVTTEQPSLVLASGTIEVVAELLTAVTEPAGASPTRGTTLLPGARVALAVAGATVLAGVSFGFSIRYRRKAIVRRISQNGL
jgi:hypothetical protein